MTTARLPDAPPGAGLRILVLEDAPMDAEILEYEIGRAGIAFTARRVDSRDGFLAALGEFRPDLILSDYTLPSFDGMAALRLAREHAPAVPFIVVTGSINEETAVGCMRAGADDYLLKSNLARIGPAIAAALERERTRAERRQAEAALRRSEANLRAILQNALQDFVLLDRAGTVLAHNRSAGEAGRWVPWGRVEEGDRVADHLPEPLAGEWPELFAQALANDMVAVEREVADGAGTARWLEATLTPVVDDAGEVIGVCLSLVDIDERKRTEEHLRRAEKMQAVGRLAGGMAHEVNNMMTVILGSAEFLARAIRADPAAEADLEAIRYAAERAANVTRQLLAFSRQQVLQPRVLDLNGVVAGLEGMLARLLGADHELRLNLSPTLGEIRADRDQLEQVLVNLLLNARDAMPRGGRVSVETGPVLLGDAYIRRHSGVRIPPGPYVMLAISDTGVGMDQATMARIFEPFFTTKPVGQGTGLGLSTVYGIVKQSGGFIWVYSEPQLGTAFKIYLPQVLDAKSGAGLAAAESNRATGGNETILVVEDEAIVRDLTCRALRDFGYRVHEAGNGGEALSLAQNLGSELQLVISDVVMPDIGGRELGRRLRTSRPELPVLYISGYTGDEVVQRGLLDPDAPFQSKPFSPEALARKIRDLLDTAIA